MYLFRQNLYYCRVKEIEDYDKVKGDIVKAAGQVFQKYGFIRVSMQDISKASGKGRSTLYYYFKNKNEVLDAFAAEIFLEMLSNSQKLLNAKNGFVDNMEVYYKTKLINLKKILKQYDKVFEDVKDDPILCVQKSKLFFKEEIDDIGTIISWAIEKGELASIATDDVKFLSETLVTAFRSFEMEMVLYGGLENFENKLNWLAQILYKGLK